MPSIAEIRQQAGGAYDDMSDQQLGDAIYKKFYSDMPRADFDTKLGLGAKPAAESRLASGYSLGPVSDVAELGARGINYLAQRFPESVRPEPRQPGPLGQEVNLPGIGKPSLGGMIQGLYGTAKSAATLPGDVYAGKVDPLSDEGIKRATDFASVAQMGGLPTVARKAATEALPGSEIKAAAVSSYEAVRDRARAVPLSEEYSQALADHVRASVSSVGPRAKAAKAAHSEIDDLAKAKDAGDLVESRHALTALIREGGPDAKAAQIALNQLDMTLDRLVPKAPGILRTADRDYAIAMKSAKVETAMKDAAEAGNQNLAGNRIRNAADAMLKRGGDEKMSDAVREAVQQTARPGLGANLLRGAAAFDPTSRVMMPTLGAIGALHNPYLLGAMPAGLGARLMYDRIMKNRAGNISEAMRAEAPATLAQPGYQPGGMVGMAPPRLPAPNMGLAPFLDEGPLRLTVRPSDAY